jgi:hypothetical protein
LGKEEAADWGLVGGAEVGEMDRDRYFYHNAIFQ